MNSFRSVHRAIDSEIARQIAIVESGGRVIQETRGWDESAETTHSMRSKEQAHDYRYFPDPDLVPIELDRRTVDRVAAELPELPLPRFERYHREFGLTAAQATQLLDNAPLAGYFDAVVAASHHPQQSTNFVLGDLSRLANESGLPVHESPVIAEHVAELIALVESKTVNSKIAKELLARMWAGEGSPKSMVDREGLAQTSDTGAVEKFVDDVLASNEKAAADYRNGKTNILGFLTGQVLKQSRGKANPELVQELLKRKLR
ncbi:MAG: hypothetical protein M3R35_01830 [Candidatus Eremiobacteraeota bacterium]|nr:hypothetical protein [Candidatus Eremiobacteraeota bacterium]